MKRIGVLTGGGDAAGMAFWGTMMASKLASAAASRAWYSAWASSSRSMARTEAAPATAAWMAKPPV